MFALLLVWWRWPAFRVWIEAPKYFMLRQERRFDHRNAAGTAAGSIQFMAHRDYWLDPEFFARDSRGGTRSALKKEQYNE
jgi:hypothetical protein